MADSGTDPRRYTERLTVPWHWWVVAAVGVGFGGAEIFAGFNWRVAVLVYLAIGIPVVALLVGMNRLTVTVDADGLHAGGRTLPLDRIATARALDRAETRRWLGPGGSPAAHVVARGYVAAAVLVRPVDDDATPYWLVSTRHPDRLLAALTGAGVVTA